MTMQLFKKKMKTLTLACSKEKFKLYTTTVVTAQW